MHVLCRCCIVCYRSYIWFMQVLDRFIMVDIRVVSFYAFHVGVAVL